MLPYIDSATHKIVLTCSFGHCVKLLGSPPAAFDGIDGDKILKLPELRFFAVGFLIFAIYTYRSVQ